MLYFDNAATGGRKPDQVLSAVFSALRVCANPGRGGHKLSVACARLVQDCRNTLNEFFGGYGYDRVVFTKNCTEALNIAILGVLQKGDHVVTTCMEHNSVLRPLEYLRKTGVIEYDICPLDKNGNIDPEIFCSLIKPHTRMAIVTTASNVTGATPPIEQIRARLPKPVLLLCDGAQGGGHIAINMQKSGIDLLSVAGHKGMLGIQGSGALLFSDRVCPRPLLHGGTGSLSISLDMPDFYPDGLEAGTLSYPAVISLLEGARYLTLHQRKISKTLLSLTEYFLQGLQKQSNYRAYSTPNPCGIVAFAHAELQSETLAHFLSERHDIAVRGGLHCAPLMHSALKTQDGGLARISFSHYNSESEVDTLLSALREIDKSNPV
ncbi:MAG: aminotransferase class V-fold PLP-dependent enzyme [Clostridia bacterium]|nr:aminotransferase class V-fold PLP-dependent enzyme [Clostridia bacterium]